MNGEDRAVEFGPIYLPTLQRIRDLWLDDSNRSSTTRRTTTSSPPTELQISFSDGLGDAESARLGIQWSELRMYSFHYVDSDGLNWRFDRHPNTHTPEIHFHPPPDTTTTDANRPVSA